MGRTLEDYRGDVLYDVWFMGGDVDAVDYDRVNDDCLGLYAALEKP